MATPPTYYIEGLFRQGDDTLARSYLKISSGAGGVQAISAGANSTSSGTVVFSNANNVSFGMNGAGVVTAIANTVGGGAITNILFSAGTYSTYRSDITFDNSNGVTFGQNTAGVITATVRTNYQSSGAYLTTAALSQDSSKYAGTGFTTATTAGTNIVGTLNTAGLSLGVPAYLTTASAGGITAINLSAGTTSGNISAVTFSNGSGVTFGFDGSNVTASVQTNYQSPGAYLTTAMASDRGTDFVQATAGFHGTNASGTIASDGISVSVASQSAANINISAGTTSSNVSALTFSNGSGVSFGFDGTNITATVKTDYQTSGAYLTTAALSQDSSKYAGTNGSIAGGSFTLNTSGATISLPAYLTTAQPAGNYAGTNTSVVTTSGTDLSFALNTNGETIAYPKWITTYVNDLTSGRAGTGFSTTSTAGAVMAGTLDTGGLNLGVPAWLTTAMRSDAVTLSNIKISAGASSSLVSAVTFANSNGVSFGYEGTNITASVATNYVTAAPATFSYFDPYPNFNNTTSTFHQSNTWWLFPMLVPFYVSASYLRLQVSVNLISTSIGTTAVNNTSGASTDCSEVVQNNVVLYSMGAGASSRSLQYVMSNSVGLTWRFTVSQQSTSNASRQTIGQTINYPSEGTVGTLTQNYSVTATTAGISTLSFSDMTGRRYLDVPFATLISPGNYWVGMNRFTSTTGGNNIDIKFSTFGIINGNESFGAFGTSPTTSNFFMPVGVGSWTTNVQQTTSSIGLANISGNNGLQWPIPFMRFIRQA